MTQQYRLYFVYIFESQMRLFNTLKIFETYHLRSIIWRSTNENN